MKESRLFVRFIARYFLLLLVPPFLISLAALYFDLIKPTTYKLSSTVEIKHKDITNDLFNQTIEKRLMLADNAVSLLRTAGVQEQLGISKEVAVNSFRFTPFSIKIEAVSWAQVNQTKALDLAFKYLKQKFEKENNSVNFFIEEVGVREQNELSNFHPTLYVILFLFGLGVSLIIALTHSYFENY